MGRVENTGLSLTKVISVKISNDCCGPYSGNSKQMTTLNIH